MATEQERVEKLAAALLADRDRVRPEVEGPPACFACGVRRTLRTGRFCSQICRDAYDAGFPGYDQDWLKPPSFTWRWLDGRPMRTTAAGFLIRCDGCEREFESKGMKYCSAGCAHRDRERQRNRETMAEVGIEPKAKRRCEECGAVIPQWTRGKRTPSTKRFCSQKCRQRAKAKEAANNASDEKKPA